MSGKRRILMFIFFVLTIIDLYNCTLPGQEYNQLIRPIQMLLIIIWLFTKVRFSIKYFFISLAIATAGITDFVYYTTGPSSEKNVIWLIILKNCCFLGVLYLNVKNDLKFSKKLFFWAFRYVFVLVIICILMEGFTNWLAYVIAIQSGISLLLISLQKCSASIFKQLYVGYAIIILSLIFGRILMTDSRWFIEVIDRLTFVFGHLLFIAGLANIKLLANTPNISEYQTVK